MCPFYSSGSFLVEVTLRSLRGLSVWGTKRIAPLLEGNQNVGLQLRTVTAVDLRNQAPFRLTIDPLSSQVFRFLTNNIPPELHKCVICFYELTKFGLLFSCRHIE